MKKLYYYKRNVFEPYIAKIESCDVLAETNKTFLVEIPYRRSDDTTRTFEYRVRKATMEVSDYYFFDTEEQAKETLREWLTKKAGWYRDDSERALKKASLCDEAIKALEEAGK